MLSDDDIRALRDVLAGEPTPGPWVAAAHGDYGDYDGRCRILLGDDMRIGAVFGLDNPETNATANYIAAASPDRIARLLDEIERLRAENDSLQSAYQEGAELVAELRAKVDVAEAGYLAAVSKSRWQASTNAELNRLINDRNALRDDAERYRWIRQRPIQTLVQGETTLLGRLSTLDATIDAARKEEGK